MHSTARASYVGEIVDKLRQLTLDSLGDPKLTQAHALAVTLCNGPLAAAVSANVVRRLLSAPYQPHWLFLSYQRAAPSAVVIGGDPFECTELHARTSKRDCAPGSYKRSLLAMEVIKNLATTLLGTVDYNGGETAAILICLHVLGLITLDVEALQKYAETTDQPVGVLRGRNASGADRAIRAAYNAARHARKNPTRFAPPETLSDDDAADAFRESFGVIARAIAAGFVHLSTLTQYRSPDRHNPGFISRQDLLSRLLLPSRHVLIDVPQHEHEARAVPS